MRARDIKIGSHYIVNIGECSLTRSVGYVAGKGADRRGRSVWEVHHISPTGRIHLLPSAVIRRQATEYEVATAQSLCDSQS